MTSYILEHLITHQYLQVQNGHIPSNEADVKWVDSQEDATWFPGACYIKYAVSKIKALGNWPVTTKPVD